MVNLKFATLVSLSPDGFLSGESAGVRGRNISRKNVRIRPIAIPAFGQRARAATAADLPRGYFSAKSSLNRRSASRRPRSVKTTDLALLAGFSMRPC